MVPYKVSLVIPCDASLEVIFEELVELLVKYVVVGVLVILKKDVQILLLLKFLLPL
jgi:hypothetical protein